MAQLAGLGVLQGKTLMERKVLEGPAAVGKKGRGQLWRIRLLKSGRELEVSNISLSTRGREKNGRTGPK